MLPGVELLRLDSDVAVVVLALSEVLDALRAPGAKVLVGTQMIAKGHHFPDVTLVGVVNADLDAATFPTSAPRSAPSPCSSRSGP